MPIVFAGVFAIRAGTSGAFDKGCIASCRGFSAERIPDRSGSVVFLTRVAPLSAMRWNPFRGQVQTHGNSGSRLRGEATAPATGGQRKGIKNPFLHLRERERCFRQGKRDYCALRAVVLRAAGAFDRLSAFGARWVAAGAVVFRGAAFFLGASAASSAGVSVSFSPVVLNVVIPAPISALYHWTIFRISELCTRSVS